MPNRVRTSLTLKSVATYSITIIRLLQQMYQSHSDSVQNTATPAWLESNKNGPPGSTPVGRGILRNSGVTALLRRWKWFGRKTCTRVGVVRPMLHAHTISIYFYPEAPRSEG